MTQPHSQTGNPTRTIPAAPQTLALPQQFFGAGHGTLSEAGFRELFAPQLQVLATACASLPGTLSSTKGIRDALNAPMLAAGWDGRRRVTVSGPEFYFARSLRFMYQGLGVEIEFGKEETTIDAVYRRFPLFAGRKLIQGGVVLAPTWKLIETHGLVSVAPYEAVIADLTELTRHQPLPVPTLLIGVPAPKELQ